MSIELFVSTAKIYQASKPVDFRLSIDGLSRIVQNNVGTHIHDGSVYVFYNANKDKIKILFGMEMALYCIISASKGLSSG